jgi:Flp pilus assembly protein TadG
MTRTPQWKKAQRWKTSGQALILIILTFFGLLFFLGLMIDLGQIFLAKGYLRRAADAASLAAAAQFRENRTIDQMRDAADEVARMNGVAPSEITVDTCASTGGTDAQLCPQLVAGNMPKKLVRVTVVMNYPLTFMTLLGIYTVPLTETSISEAASMDVVLVLDMSESMSWEGTSSDQMDPSKCNVDNTCEPFKHVKDAALSFASNILDKSPADEEDRLAIVTFANGWQDPPEGTQLNQTWTNDYSVAAATINNLQVYDPGVTYTQGDDPPDPLPVSPSRMYASTGEYQGFICLRSIFDDPDNPLADKSAAFSACGTTDTGGGLLLAGNQFAVQKRPEALWVVVLLTDGMANATLPTESNNGGGSDPTHWILPPPYSTITEDDIKSSYPLGYCPDGDWVGQNDDPNRDFCKDGSVATQHLPSSGMYDADDFARDQARFVACPAASPPAGCDGIKGQSAIIFTIGLGNQVTDVTDTAGVPYGAALLRFIAAVGDDGNPATDPCLGISDYTVSCGNYFWAEHGTNLQKIFSAIYSRIFTRLTE